MKCTTGLMKKEVRGKEVSKSLKPETHCASGSDDITYVVYCQ